MYDDLFQLGTLLCLAIAEAALLFGFISAIITGRLTPVSAAFFLLSLPLLASAFRAGWRELRKQRQ